MALTMTRTRTQKALTKLAERLAELNGELEFVVLVLQEQLSDLDRTRMLLRRQALHDQRQALVVTLKQFDPRLDLDSIGALGTWRKTYGARCQHKTLRSRYLSRL